MPPQVQKYPNPLWARCPQFLEPGILPHANPSKQVKKTLIYDPKNSDKVIFIDKRRLNQ
jgi:hypothetical protein